MNTTRAWVPAFQKDEAFLKDIADTRPDADTFRVWWLGQSGFLVAWKQHHILFDPYLSDSLTKKYAQTDRPHERMGEQVVQAGALDFIDIVTSSHNHTDHLDGETLIPLLACNPGIRLLCPEANRDFVAQRIGKESDFPLGINDGEAVQIGACTFYGIPAAHNTLDRDDAGRCKYMGFVMEFGAWRVYHSGDTLWYEGMEDILRPFQVDIAFLPINGNDPARGVAGNLNAEEAARLGKAIGARCVIPHHYDMFRFNTADPATFERYARQYDTPYRVLRLGEGISSTDL